MKQTPVTEEKLDRALAETKNEVKNWFQEMKDDIFNRLDDISGQLETIREEQILAFGKDREFEERITTLENPKS